MRIAILGARGIPARYGGFETFAEQLGVRLVKRGHDVTVFCEASEEAAEEYKGVRLRHVASHEIGPLRTLLYDAACLWHARSEFDVVYMLGYGSSAFCWLPRLWGSQVWINMDGLEWARAKWGRFARMYFRLAEWLAMRTPSRIIADAAAIKANLESRHRRMPPCDVIPYGCEVFGDACVEELSGFGLVPGSYYLVLCRFEPENHIKEVIEGFLMSGSQKRLVLIGDHERRSGYVQSLKTYEDSRVMFAGPVYDDQKVRALRYFCCAYLHGHSVGGTNPSLVEAMGCGNLVVAHDNEFNREVLGEAGLYFTAPAVVSRVIASVESGAVDTACLRTEAAERVRRFYTWEMITEHYCKLLSLIGSETADRGEEIQGGPALAGRRAAARPTLGD